MTELLTEIAKDTNDAVISQSEYDSAKNFLYPDENGKDETAETRQKRKEAIAKFVTDIGIEMLRNKLAIRGQINMHKYAKYN